MSRNEEIIKLYQDNIDIADIQSQFNLSRVSIYNILKKNGLSPNRRSVENLTCKFCGEKFQRIHALTKRQPKGQGGYCSPSCYHADRSRWGEYSSKGGAIARTRNSDDDVKPDPSKHSKKAIQETGIELVGSQVIHHIDGNKNNNDISNLRIFESQSAHMQFHHSLRNKRIKKI